MNRVFLLSPANCNGLRARQLMAQNSRSPLAQRLRAENGVAIGEVFTYLSALYFRGKLSYALAFARPPAHATGVAIITPTDGLISCDTAIDVAQLRSFGRVAINVKNRRYREALCRTAKALAENTAPTCEIILLGSIASDKYLSLLLPVFGARLRVPAQFIGLGDMSRGGLLLRCVREQRELEYIAASALPTRLVRTVTADR